jgi:hypothetical protein
VKLGPLLSATTRALIRTLRSGSSSTIPPPWKPYSRRRSSRRLTPPRLVNRPHCGARRNPSGQASHERPSR